MIKVIVGRLLFRLLLLLASFFAGSNRFAYGSDTSNFCNYSYPGAMFPPIYWINLDYSYERRTRFQNLMSQMGCIHQRVAAIKPDQLVVRVQVDSPHTFSAKEYACIASHVLAMQTAILRSSEYKNPYALIL